MATTFDDAVRERAREVAELVIRKQKDYGPKNILNCPLGPQQGLIVRLFDKIARIGNLVTKRTTANNEPLRDSWSDVVGYGLIGLMVEDGTFNLPLAEDAPVPPEPPFLKMPSLAALDGGCYKIARRPNGTVLGRCALQAGHPGECE
jgi:hypothetical protein